MLHGLQHVVSYAFAGLLLARTSTAIGWGCCGGGPGYVPAADQLSGCALYCLQNAPVNYWNCESVDCICPENHLSQAVAAITSCAAVSCMNDPSGVALATNIATSYCQTWSVTAPPSVVGVVPSTSTATTPSITTPAPAASSGEASSPGSSSPASTQMTPATNLPTSTPMGLSTNQPTSTKTPSTPSASTGKSGEVSWARECSTVFFIVVTSSLLAILWA